MMRKISFLLFIFMATALAQMEGPKITSPSTEYNFGEVIQGDKVNHVFTLTNNGGEKLIIHNVNTSCGCTAAQPEKLQLEPGESTSLKVTFNSTGRIGKQKKQISVISNDPENKVFTLKITGTVIHPGEAGMDVPKVDFDNITHDFGVINEGDVVTHEFKIMNNGNADLLIKDVKTSCGCTAATPSGNVIKPKNTGTIKVEFDSKGRHGKMTKTVSVITNDPVHQYTILTIFATIQDKKGN